MVSRVFRYAYLAGVILVVALVGSVSPATAAYTMACPSPLKRANVAVLKQSRPIGSAADIATFVGYDAVASTLVISSSKLETIGGLESLRRVEGLTIWENRQLRDLRGLDGLRVIGWPGFSLSDNPSLETLTGLSNISVIDGDIVIESSGRLRSLDGLRCLQNVIGNLRIAGNPRLESIEALASVRVRGREILEFGPGGRSHYPLGLIEIVNNPRLPTDHIRATVNKLGFRGTVVICGNAGGQPCRP